MRWKNLPDEDATWESEEILQHPSLQLLEDKQHFAGGDCNIPNLLWLIGIFNFVRFLPSIVICK